MTPDNAGNVLRFCSQCGNRLSDNDWHPVVTESYESGETVLHSFCDEECKTTWGADG